MGLINVDNTNNTRWLEQKAGPMVYVSETGTLESATAPLADCPRAVLSFRHHDEKQIFNNL